MNIIDNNVIFNSVDNGIIILDENLNIQAWNRWLEVLTHLKEENIVNQNICELFSYINEKKLKRKIKSVLVTKTPSFYNVNPNKYLIQIPIDSITNTSYTFMQQNVTIVPYDEEKKLVCVFIYDTTILSEANSKLEKLNNDLLEMSHKDPLTHLFNRRYFSTQSKKVQAFSKRNNLDLSLIVLDIDKFKAINDTYGHLIGDEVIIHLSKILAKSVRESDIVSRFGGEEFVVLLQDCNAENTYIVAEKLREEIEHSFVELPDEKILKYTISLGIAQFDEKLDDDNLEHTFARADTALYEAKLNGRNQAILV